MSKKLPVFDVVCPTCGQTFAVNAARIARGRGKFCSRACSAKFNSPRHGHSRHNWQSRTYNSWAAMKQRCQNPLATKFPDYGAKGIRVCDRWQSFEVFLADMGERPEGTSLDRIDGNGNYEPDNCRWATPKEQQSHVSNITIVFYRGERVTLPELSQRLGIQRTTLRYRIKHWPEERWASREHTRQPPLLAV